MATVSGDQGSGTAVPTESVGPALVASESVAQRVHVDLPRISPDQMMTSQPSDAPPDPTGGRDTETEFMLRHLGW